MSNGATPSETFPSERLSVVLDSAPAIVWLWDPAAGCTYVSPAWTRITGRPAAEAWGEGWARIVHPDDAEAFAACRAAMRRNERYATEYRLLRADGTYATVNDQGYPLEAAAGPFLGAALEVTAQREAEALVRASDALLSAVAEGMGVALGVKDRGGRYLIANDAMSTLLGVAPGNAIGRTDRDLGLDDWTHRDEQDRVVLGGVDVRAEDERDATTFLTAKSPLRGGDDAIEGVIVVGTDISTERARRGRAERLDRLTQALSASTSVHAVADTVFVEALEALETRFGALGLVEPDGRTIDISRLRGFESKRAAWRSLVVDEDDTPITRAVRDNTSAFYGSAEDVLARFPHLRGQLLEYQARAVLPLRSGDEILGVLYVAFRDEQRFDADRRAYCLAVADRIAQALERARLFDAARRSDEHTRALQAVTADLGAAMTVEEVQLVTTRAACAAVGADACMLAIADLEAAAVTYVETDAYPPDLRALLPTTLEPGASPVADVIAQGTSLVFDTNAMLIGAYPHLAELIQTLPFTARAFVPVGAPGVPTGVLIASSAQEARFDTERVRLLEAIAGQCGQALQRAVLYRDTRAATERAAALQEATLAIADATTISDAVEPAVSFALDLVNADIGGLLLVDPDTGRLSVAHEVGVPPVLLERWGNAPVDAIPMIDHAVESRRGQWRATDELRELDPEVAAELRELGVGSVGVLPLISGGGVLGVLGLARGAAPPDRFVQDTLEAFAERVGAAIYRARLLETERRTRHQLERTLSRLSRLQTVSDAISQGLPVDEVADRALSASIDALGALGGGAYLAEGGALRLIAAEGTFRSAVGGRLDTVPFDAEMAMCASFASGTVNWIPTYREWQQRHAFGALMFKGIARSTIAIPFVLEDRVLGVMTLVFTDENVLDRPERRLARTIGHQAAVALERSQLYEREVARSRRTEQIQHLIAELAGSADAGGIAAILTSTAIDVIGADAAAVVLVDEGGDGATADVVASSGFPEAVLDAVARDVRGPSREAVTSGRPAFLRTADAVADRYPEFADTLGSALAELPLSAGGETLGALLVRFAEPQPFNLEQIDLLAAVASEAAQATQRARVRRREREISRILQDSLLPDEPTSAWKGARVMTWYSAGTQHLDVGGDWYDAIELPNGRLGVSIGDVVGRGLRAAAAMGQLRSALRGIALEMRGPAATLEALNRYAARTPGTELATVAYGEYDPTTGAFVYACAGHPPPVACIDGRAIALEDGRSPLLAAGYDGPRAESTCLLPPHSTLVLYTDGLVERRDEPFHRGVDRLRSAVERSRDADPADLIDVVVESVLGTRERTDDAALLVLRTGAPIPFEMTLDDAAEALRPLRHRLQAWLSLRGCTPDEADAVVLAVNEAAANAIEHGYRDGGGPVEVTGDLLDDELQLSVVDHGAWRAAEPDPARGRGLPLMRTLMDAVDIDILEPGTRVVLRRKVAVGTGEPAMAGSDGRG